MKSFTYNVVASNNVPEVKQLKLEEIKASNIPFVRLDDYPNMGLALRRARYVQDKTARRTVYCYNQTTETWGIWTDGTNMPFDPEAWRGKGPYRLSPLK